MLHDVALNINDHRHVVRRPCTDEAQNHNHNRFHGFQFGRVRVHNFSLSVVGGDYSIFRLILFNLSFSLFALFILSLCSVSVDTVTVICVLDSYFAFHALVRVSSAYVSDLSVG